MALTYAEMRRYHGLDEYRCEDINYGIKGAEPCWIDVPPELPADPLPAPEPLPAELQDTGGKVPPVWFARCHGIDPRSQATIYPYRQDLHYRVTSRGKALPERWITIYNSGR